MYGIKKLSLSVFILLLFSTAQVSADDFYIGAGFNVLKVDTLSTTSQKHDKEIALFLGYQFIDTNFFMFSVEAGYYGLGTLENSLNTNAEGYSLAGVAYLPLGPLFEVYAKLGAVQIHVDGTNNTAQKEYSGAGSLGAVGASIDILDTFDFYVEYSVFGNLKETEMIGAGIRVDF